MIVWTTGSRRLDKPARERLKRGMTNRISPQQAKQRLDDETDSSVYLDVRSVREFSQGHPQGATNIPFADHHPMLGNMVPNPQFAAQVERRFGKDARLICACAMGGRSMRAAGALAQAGFTDVVDMIGGFSGRAMPPEPGWAQLDLPVATDGETWEQVKATIAA